MDLLTPIGVELRGNYVHQLQQTINAYLPSYRYVGEALQNALDAVRESGGGKHVIKIDLDLDAQQVLVQDDGPGFPNDARLLFLGGGRKKGRGYAGLVGVGLKVVLFSTEYFLLRARSITGESLRLEVSDAYRFAESPTPEFDLGLEPDGLFAPDPTPLEAGTQLVYKFPSPSQGISVQDQYLRDVKDESFSGPSFAHDFGETLANAASAGIFPSRLAALIGLNLKRYSYLGMTTVPSQLEETTVEVTLRHTNPESCLGVLAELADGQTSCSFTLNPGYLRVNETVSWTPKNRRRPFITDHPLLNGGRGLSRTDVGFNITSYTGADEYELLLTNARGIVTGDVAVYQSRLWDRLNRIDLAIGRIPEFEKYLPNGPRHVFSANGVVTAHAVEFNRGQNQQYVRCFDITIDVEGQLNYGKTQLTDMHLVGLLRRFLNDAYAITIQHAAANFVGKLRPIGEPTEDAFLTRPNLKGDLSQRKVPRDENDVIALFFELTGLGEFPDYRWFGLSSKDTYDGRAVVRRSSDVDSILSDPPNEGSLRVVEFKLRAGSIARDFNREEKDPRRLDLVIAYELGLSTLPDQYQILPIENSQIGKSMTRVFPRVSHVMFDAHSGAEVQILLLRQVIAEMFPDPPPPNLLPSDVEDDD